MGTTAPPRGVLVRVKYWLQFALLLACVHFAITLLTTRDLPSNTNTLALLRDRSGVKVPPPLAPSSSSAAVRIEVTAPRVPAAKQAGGATAPLLPASASSLARFVTLHSIVTGKPLDYKPEAGIPESASWLGAHGASGQGIVFEVVELGSSPDDEAGVDAWQPSGFGVEKQKRPQGSWIALRVAEKSDMSDTNQQREPQMLEVVPPSEEFAWVVRTSACLMGDVCERHMLQLVPDANAMSGASHRGEVNFVLSRFTRAYVNVVDGLLRGHGSALRHKPAGMEPSARFRVVEATSTQRSGLALSSVKRDNVAHASAAAVVDSCSEMYAMMQLSSDGGASGGYSSQWKAQNCEFHLHLESDTGDGRAVPGTVVDAVTAVAAAAAPAAPQSAGVLRGQYTPADAGKYFIIRCIANNRFVMPGGGGGGDPWLVAAGTEDTEVAHMAFHLVATKFEGWVALRSRSKNRYVEAVPPAQEDGWVWKLKSVALTERNLLKIEPPVNPRTVSDEKFVYIYSKFLSAHLNYLGANDLRAHGSKPLNTVPAGQEVSARFELREVSQEELHASDARLKEKKRLEKLEEGKAVDEIAKLTQPPAGEKWVISFGLYGSNPKYTVGALENGRLAKSVFPGWTVRMYHDETVPAEILSELRALDVELVKQNDIHGGIAGMFWRFLPASDPTVARYIVRDTDSRLSPRERHAVEEWIKSKKPIHSIRDHPNHDRGLNGGMWGGTRDAVPDMDRLVRAWSSRGHYGADLDFLNQRVWPSVVAKSYSSDSYTCHKWPNSHPFPTRRNDDFEHVGQVFFADNTFRHLDIDNYMKGRHVPEKCRAQPDWLYG